MKEAPNKPELSEEDRQWIKEQVAKIKKDWSASLPKSLHIEYKLGYEDGIQDGGKELAGAATLRMKAKLSEVEKREAELKFLLKLSRSYLPNGWVNDGKGNGFMFKDRLEAALNNASNENNDKK